MTGQRGCLTGETPAAAAAATPARPGAREARQRVEAAAARPAAVEALARTLHLGGNVPPPAIVVNEDRESWSMNELVFYLACAVMGLAIGAAGMAALALAFGW